MKILIDQATMLLQMGEVIAIPTDTVYGLAASFSNKQAEEQIYLLKKRPKTSPLVLFVKAVDEIIPFISHVPEGGNAIMNTFWPGPLTIIFPDRKESTIAIRIPDHPLILSLLQQTGPLFVTSANLSGHPPLKTINEIETTFGTDFPILDGPLPPDAPPSTIISFKNNLWQITRLGALSAKNFKPVLGYAPNYF